MNNSSKLKTLAEDEAAVFKSLGYEPPDRNRAPSSYWRTIEEVVQRRAEKLVDSLLVQLMKGYIQHAKQFLVTEIISELYDQILFDADEQGPFIRLTGAKPHNEQPNG